MGIGEAKKAEDSGSMAQRVRAHAWETTSLGAVQTWPDSLRAAMAHCLSSGRPSLLWWGPELLQIPNDAARTALDGQQAALAVAAADAWRDVWDQLSPMVERALHSAAPAFVKGLHSSSPAVAMPWSFGLCPMHNEAGHVTGML